MISSDNNALSPSGCVYVLDSGDLASTSTMDERRDDHSGTGRETRADGGAGGHSMCRPPGDISDSGTGRLATSRPTWAARDLDTACATSELLDSPESGAAVDTDRTSTVTRPGPGTEKERRIGPYELRHTLGRGAMGKVKLAVHLPTGQLVAIKVIPWSLISKSEKHERNLRREMELMLRLDHPNVVRVRDAVWSTPYPKKSGADGGRVALIVMDLAHGGEVYPYLAAVGRPFPEGIARHLFQQAALGISHCHAAGVAHRDIKPDNLIFDAEFNVKVADFGLASPIEADDLLRTQCGTSMYKAPEVVARNPYSGTAADVWSAGVLLFVFVMGRQPFMVASNHDEWARFVLCAQYDLFWRYHGMHLAGPLPSEACRDLINSMLRANPAERPSMTEVLKHAWFNDTVVATPAEVTGELTRRKEEVDRSIAQETTANKLKKEERRRSVRAAAGGCSVEAFAAGVHRDASQPCAEPLPPVYETFEWKTYFYSNADVMSLVQAAEEALCDMGCAVSQSLRSPGKLRAHLATADSGEAPTAEAAPRDAVHARAPKHDTDGVAVPAAPALPGAAAETLHCVVQVFSTSTSSVARHVVVVQCREGNHGTFVKHIYVPFVIRMAPFVVMPEPLRLHPADAGDDDLI